MEITVEDARTLSGVNALWRGMNASSSVEVSWPNNWSRIDASMLHFVEPVAGWYDHPSVPGLMGEFGSDGELLSEGAIPE